MTDNIVAILFWLNGALVMGLVWLLVAVNTDKKRVDDLVQRMGSSESSFVHFHNLYRELRDRLNKVEVSGDG